MSLISTMPELASANGGSSSPCSPKRNTLSLTEYSATPMASLGEKNGSEPEWEVPEAFLLPNGHPDVRIFS